MRGLNGGTRTVADTAHAAFAMKRPVGAIIFYGNGTYRTMINTDHAAITGNGIDKSLGQCKPADEIIKDTDGKNRQVEGQGYQYPPEFSFTVKNIGDKHARFFFAAFKQKIHP